jgi:hypothetical protein
MGEEAAVSHPVLDLPPGAPLLDLRFGPVEPAPPWSIGRYNEDRGIYTQPLFTAGPAPRTVHMGVDLGGPAGEPIWAPTPGRVLHAGYNAAAGDYGHVLVLEHRLGDRPIWALYGHLSARSLELSPPGREVEAGALLGWLGRPEENGGWPPHVHVQLCWERPATHDLPGAVARKDRAAALARYPDPRLLLGPVYALPGEGPSLGQGLGLGEVSIRWPPG